MRKFNYPNSALALVACITSIAAPAVASEALAAPVWGSDFPVFPLQEKAETEALFPMALCNGFKLEEATIDQMQEAMKQGKLTSQQLVICYLQRNYQTEDYIK
jgi:amidase